MASLWTAGGLIFRMKLDLNKVRRKERAAEREEKKELKDVEKGEIGKFKRDFAKEMKDLHEEMVQLSQFLHKSNQWINSKVRVRFSTCSELLHKLVDAGVSPSEVSGEFNAFNKEVDALIGTLITEIGEAQRLETAAKELGKLGKAA
jgi:hypothetical protein